MNKKSEFKVDALARIRSEGPTPEDLADERPRVRRAALCYLAASGSDAECVRALDTAASSTEVIFLAVARTVARKRVTVQGVPARDAVQAAIDLRGEKRGTSYSVADFYLATEDAP